MQKQERLAAYGKDCFMFWAAPLLRSGAGLSATNAPPIVGAFRFYPCRNIPLYGIPNQRWKHLVFPIAVTRYCIQCITTRFCFRFFSDVCKLTEKLAPYL